jgi:hypothetical protein
MSHVDSLRIIDPSVVGKDARTAVERSRGHPHSERYTGPGEPAEAGAIRLRRSLLLFTHRKRVFLRRPGRNVGRLDDFGAHFAGHLMER